MVIRSFTSFTGSAVRFVHRRRVQSTQRMAITTMEGQNRARSASPPAKRVRQGSPDVHVHGNGQSSQNTLNTSNAIDKEISAVHGKKPFIPFTAKQQAKRVKALVRDREKQMEKFGEKPITFDIYEILGQETVNRIIAQGSKAEFEHKFPLGTELDCTIERLSAHGLGLARSSTNDWVVAVPHVVPGERVRIRITSNDRMHSCADLVEILESSSASASASIAQRHTVERRDDLVRCRYYNACSGCQYQHIAYLDQLRIKKNVVEDAFRRHSNLQQSQVPKVDETLPSPMQYDYRTKLTPHFQLPSEVRKRRKGNNKAQNANSDQDAEKANAAQSLDVPIGFDAMGEKKVLDIEECVIATPTINAHLPAERKRVKDSIFSYSNGATLLLRDSLKDFDLPPSSKEETTVITDHKAVVKECVGSTKFFSPAGAFFQNNRSILPSLLAFVKQEIENHAPKASIDGTNQRFLVDTYCGSGLFALCLASLFTRVAGVEISKDSIEFAHKNAKLNNVSNATFIASDAQEIFAQITFDPARTTVIIDPPRRGCDEPFVRQLLTLGPQLIVYVSCNVHTQARDVGQIINGLNGAPKRKYEIVSLRGADMFPQTYHVEGLCILKLLDQ